MAMFTGGVWLTCDLDNFGKLLALGSELQLGIVRK